MDTQGLVAGARDLDARLRADRRAFHRRPELAWAEHRTAAYIEHRLSNLGIPHRRVLGTGVVAVVEGRGDRVVGIRADMDGLPIAEAEGRAGYRSEVDGMSHACGHDSHLAVALGLAELVASQPSLPGTVCFYFQPAEEGSGGAAPMVADGVLDDPRPDAIIGLHAASRLPVGTIGLRRGVVTGSHDFLKLRIHGVGGHGAHPELSVDPIPIAATIVTAIQQLITREISALDNAVVTFGSIHGGTAPNIIAPTVTLDGTLRTLDPGVRKLLLERIREVTQGIAAAHRAWAEVDTQAGYDVGVNHAGLAGLVGEAVVATLGPERLVWERHPSLGAEDFFAFGATGVPVCLFQLGVANVLRGITAPHHSPDFDLDEDALAAGLAVMAESARRVLVGEGPQAP